MASKNVIMQEYVQSFFDNTFITFNSVEMYPGAKGIVPISGDYLVSTDILGSMKRQYVFSMVAIEILDTGTNLNNAQSLDIFEQFNNIIIQKNDAHEYPDFGDKCYDYSLKPLNNIGDTAFVDEQGNVKYILSAKLTYQEEK